MSSSVDQLKALAERLSEELETAAGQAGSEHRMAAAQRLARRLKQIAASAPEVPADPESKEAVDRTMVMMRSMFPGWDPFTEEDEGT